ncbi:hypothetical protein N7508_002534 [Penicillium antarcticum]|uniref:uncharacterized protein n=1 Tax=Penicillium antarcticum TaxID=416450 RepID=UPI00238FAB5F|nr:uncharacterized protein N7508_002534 [Penicillium antarcticum]KAJ5318026.1 hypothetical protein N7508_002534 [Penicillium antarcticum]
MDAIEQSTQNARAHLTQVPVAQLSPDLAQPSEKFIVAVVTLIWPYSSSKKSLSLLLAEPDARLRRPNGQVRATFHGRVAQKIAESHVGIRDTIHLSLAYAKFISNEAVTQTPGRSVAWDAHFEDAVSLEVHRSSEPPLTISVEPQPTVPSHVELAPPSTPVRQTAKHGLETVCGMGSWGSPAFMQSARDSFGGLIDTSRDPFADDGFVPGTGRKRPRYSLQREDWRLVDESESSVDKEVPVDWWEQTLEHELNAEDANGQPSDEPMADAAPLSDSENAPLSVSVFAKPSLELTGSIIERRAGESNNNASQESSDIPGQGPPAFPLPTDTPQIRPIPSPGLPIPSPLVSNHANSTEYFTSWSASTQTEEIRSVPAETASIASPPESAFETREIHESNMTDETPFIESLEPLVMEPIESNIASLQAEAVLDTDSLLHDILAPSTGSEDLPNEVDIETIESPSTVNEPSIAQTDVEIRNDDEVKQPSEDKRLELLSVGDRDLQREDEDIHENMQAVQPEGEIDNEEDSLSDSEMEIQSSGQPHSTSVLDANKVKKTEPTAKPPGDLDSGDEAGASIESLSVPRSRSQSYAEEDVEMVEGEEQYDEEADDYESQYDYDDDEDHHVPRLGTRLEQEEFSGDEANVDNSTDEDSEQERSFPSRPETQEVIVLDSDSEDEPAPSHPAVSTSQSPDEKDRSQSPRYDQSIQMYADRAESNEESSGSDQSEKIDEANAYESDDQDDRVHDSDKAGESSFEGFSGDENAQGDEQEIALVDLEQNHDVPMAELEHEEQDRDSDLIAGIESEMEQVADQSSDEEQPGDAYRSVPDVPEAIDQLPHQDNENMADPVVLSDTEKIDTFFDMDGASDTDISLSFEEDAADFISAPEQPIETTEITYLDPQVEPLTPEIIVSLSEQQLPTPDPTQESALPNQRGEPKTSLTGEQNEQLDLDAHFPHMRAAGSIPPENIEDVPAPENAHDPLEKEFGLDGATDYPSERQPLEVVISTEAPETPEVVVTEPQPSNPDRNAPGLRSKYSYFAPLATLIDHYNALVDTISIVHEVSPIAKAKTGSKDWFMTIQLTDPSMAGTTLQAQMFRRYKSTFPSLFEGNAVLLRDFKVRSFNHTIMIVSAETSAWAVFDGSSPDAQVKGPPVEYGSEESEYALELHQWYTDMGSARIADHQLQASIERESMDRETWVTSQPPSESESPDSTRSSRRTRRGRHSGRVTIHSLRDGTRYIEVGSPNSRGSDSIHELRDGTVYSNP